MAKKPETIDLRERILSDTEKYRNVDVKKTSVRVFSGADPDTKLLAIDFSFSYDGRNWITCKDQISIEGEQVSSKKDIDERARKYFKSVVDSVGKKGVKSMKYSEDEYVFRR